MLNRVLSDPEDMVKAGLEAGEVAGNGVAIPEPSSREEAMLRMSLLPGALRSVAHNLRHGRADVRLFEIGSVHRKGATETGVEETMELIAVATAGRFGPDLTQLDPEMDYARFKGVIEAFLDVLRVDTPEMRCYDVTDFQADTSAIIESRGKRLGVLGLLAPEISEAFEISRPVLAARFTLTDLLGAVPSDRRYVEPSRYPDSRRDLAFLVDDSIPEATVRALIRKFGGELLVETTLFDRFTGGALPPGKVNLAYALRFQAGDRTLSDEEVRSAERRIVHGLDQELGATLRA
jgi:phenylalanyl-tRNA synthetase beta chain